MTFGIIATAPWWPSSDRGEYRQSISIRTRRNLFLPLHLYMAFTCLIPDTILQLFYGWNQV